MKYYYSYKILQWLKKVFRSVCWHAGIKLLKTLSGNKGYLLEILLKDFWLNINNYHMTMIGFWAANFKEIQLSVPLFGILLHF